MYMYVFDVCFHFVSMATGDGGAGSAEEERLLCAARGGETKVVNNYFNNPIFVVNF